MQRSNCSSAESSNEPVLCLKFPWRKIGKSVGREKEGSEKTTHGVRKEANSSVRDGGRKQYRERESAEAVGLLCAVSEVHTGASNL